MDSSGNVREKCKFVLERKNRPCRMLALKGEPFCGEHTVHDTSNLTQLSEVLENRIRIKCPLDGTHTCFAHRLQHHLKVCNARVREVPPYYVQDINSGDGEPQCGATIHQLSDQALLSLLQRVRTTYTERVPAVATVHCTHPVLADSLANPEYGVDTLKHLRQNAALLGLLRDARLLDGRRTFVELGSGKALLSSWLARAVSSEAQIVLVDRASHRHKAENKLKDLDDVCDIQRLKIDIRHLSLAGCGACVGRPVVAISKHLCGAATDLGIRAATAGLPPSAAGGPAAAETAAVSSDAAVDAQSGPGEHPTGRVTRDADPDVRGVLIALCCHHRVEWPSYVGKEFLQACGFPSDEFTALKGVAAWATCGTPSWEQPTQTAGHSTEEPVSRANDHVSRAPDQAAMAQPRADPPSGDAVASSTGPTAEPATTTYGSRPPTAAAATPGSPHRQKRAGSDDGADAKRARQDADGGAGHGTDQDRLGRDVVADQTRCDRRESQPSPDSGELQSGGDNGKDRPDHGTADDRPDHGTADDRPDHGTADDRPDHGTADDRPDHGTADDRPGPGSGELQSGGDNGKDRPDHDTADDRPGPGSGELQSGGDNGKDRPDHDTADDRPGPGSRQANGGRYHRLGLTPEERTQVGFMCKRLLDEGRRQFLVARGFDARLLQYVEASVSPENVLLLATR